MTLVGLPRVVLQTGAGFFVLACAGLTLLDVQLLAILEKLFCLVVKL